MTALVLFLLGAALFTAGGLSVEMETADLVPAVSLFSLTLAAAGKLLPLLVMRFARLLIVLAVVASAVAAISFALEKT